MNINFLQDKYIAVIQNDPDWYGKVLPLKNTKDWVPFIVITLDYINNITRKENHLYIPPSHRYYIYVALWTELNIEAPEALVIDAEYARLHNHQYVEKALLAYINRQPQPQPQYKEYETMKTETVKIQTITYINGGDINQMSVDQLIDSIRTCEDEIDGLKAIQTKSSAIDKKIANIEATLSQLVIILDGKN